MENFRLKVFRSVARHLSFTKAANELFITQPAITKHIQSLEREYGLRLFNRKGNKIYLTQAGSVLLEYSNKIFNLELKLENDLNKFKDNLTGKLRLGASTTIAQYVIPQVISKFHEKYPHVKLTLHSGNTEQIAELLNKGEIDLGIVEGKVKNRDIHYIRFLSDELVAATSLKNNLLKKDEISFKELITLPLIMRERGSGTLEVIEHALKARKIKLSSLRIVMYLGSTEAIKRYLENDNSIGFISTRAIEREIKQGTLKVIKIRDFKIIRSFDFITLHGSDPTNTAAQFIKFAVKLYNQK
ncbi:MAG: selenium metabolism-associated LysR family transcriptional regulator [Bacteroidetes bacterium]|nr:selenium metabolism-associated LysR family transcriptional regulator [Bacteroidota bacterium]